MINNVNLYNAAHNFIGTKFINNGLSCHGCDCFGLIFLTLQKVNYIDTDITSIRLNFSVYSNIESVIDIMTKFLKYHSMNSQDIHSFPESILFFSMPKSKIHFGIYKDGKIIHSVYEVGRVIECNLSAKISKYIIGYFTVK